MIEVFSCPGANGDDIGENGEITNDNAILLGSPSSVPPEKITNNLAIRNILLSLIGDDDSPQVLNFFIFFRQTRLSPYHAFLSLLINTNRKPYINH